MKHFEAIGVIEYCYFQLSELTKKMSEPKTPIQSAIDLATGLHDEQHQGRVKSSVELLKQIIEAKKAIGRCYKSDIKTLAAVKKMKIEK